MKRTLAVVAIALTLLAAAPIAHNNDDWWGGVGSFRPIANFNVPGATSAEIISVSRDGRFLVYSDAIGQKFGLVDITNPSAPRQVGSLAAGGDPTSVAVLPVGHLAVAAVQPGKLVLIDLATFTIIATRAIGPGPDSVAVTRIGGQVVAVIAIENEGAEKGFVEILRLDLSSAAGFCGLAEREDRAQRSGRPDGGRTHRRGRSAAGVREHPRHEGRGDAAGEQRHRDHRHQQSG
jgi:hypothetical protein